MPPARVLTHDAMNTTFSLHLPEGLGTTARDMARECFDQLDFLESRLSRFAEGSDISRVNHLRAGETLYLNEATHRCLLAAADAYARTGGLFDITLGSHIEHRKSGGVGEMPPLVGSLTIHPDVPAVTCNLPGRQIDLGGIGKGFALDELQQLLTEWEAPGGLVAAGASSLLAFGPDDWPVSLPGERGELPLRLARSALSVSGTAMQGSHIIHPGGDEAMPADACRRLWAIAPTATLAEIWSTALFLLNPREIAGFVAGDESVGEIYIDRDGTVERLR